MGLLSIGLPNGIIEAQERTTSLTYLRRALPSRAKPKGLPLLICQSLRPDSSNTHTHRHFDRSTPKADVAEKSVVALSVLTIIPIYKMKSYISKIRVLINKTILKSLLLKNQKKWNLMCGSIDAIESTQLAVDYYNCLDKDTGYNYLIIYGLFQSLYVQQDSVLNLCKSIGIQMSKKDIKAKYPELWKIRQLRNKGIGHPSKDRENNTHSMLIEGDSVELFSYSEAGEFSHSTHNISECIETQNRLLCKIVQQVIEGMKLMEQKHKDKYMENKLRDCFPTDHQYCIGKIFEAINLIDVKSQGESEPQRIGRENGISLAFSHLKTLIEAINKFNEEFTKRGLQDIHFIVSIEIEHSKYPLEKLKEYFSSTSESSINSQDARAYADSAQIHILELATSAQNLDNEYSNTT